MKLKKSCFAVILLIFLLLLSSCSDVELELHGGTADGVLSQAESEVKDNIELSVSDKVFENLENGMTYDEILKLVGKEDYIINSSYFWKTKDGRTARLDFCNDSNTENKYLSNEAYIFSKTPTGVTRVTDANDILRVELCYTGNKLNTVEISDERHIIASFVEYINRTDGDFVNSTRGYSGALYEISLYSSNGEAFVFEVWDEYCYSTNEYVDGKYKLLAYDDISELYQYLTERYDEKRFCAEKIEIGMTYADVKRIMGSDGTDDGSDVILYRWELSDGKTLSVWLNYTTGVAPDSIDELVVAKVLIE